MPTILTQMRLTMKGELIIVAMVVVVEVFLIRYHMVIKQLYHHQKRKIKKNKYHDEYEEDILEDSEMIVNTAMLDTDNSTAHISARENRL